MAAKKQATAEKVKVTQIGSPIGRKYDQRANLLGLGLNKLFRSNVLVNTAETQGMIRKVEHLVKVEAAE